MALPAGRPWRVPVLTWFSERALHSEGGLTGVELEQAARVRDGFTFITAAGRPTCREYVWCETGSSFWGENCAIQDSQLSG